VIAQRLIEDARAAGLSIEVDGDDLIVEADGDLPPELIAGLRQHKAEVVALLLPTPGRSAVGESDALGEPVVLRDGRRLYRFRAVETASSGDVGNLLDRARWRGAVLVADGRELIVVEPWLSTLPPETLRKLSDNAAAVISVLIGESRERVDAAHARFSKGATG
jgi:hypothetical protein